MEPLPVPPTTAAPPSTTIAPDFSGVSLGVVRGATTTTTISLGPGEAAFKGTVAGPDGPVANASVRVERLVAGAVAANDVVTQPDGSWELPGIKGGAYRVRAWRSPDLALVEPAFIFIGSKQVFPLDLKLDRYTGPFATGAVAPNPPVVGAPVNLVVQLSSRSVDDRGFVVGVPLVGAVVLLGTATSAWQLLSANPVSSDANGRARWELRCSAAGANPLTVAVDRTAPPLPLTLPPCVEPVAAPAPGAPAPAPSSSLPRRATTTTKPAVSTTTTTKPTTTTRATTTTTRRR